MPVQPESAKSDKTGQQQTPTITGRSTELIHNGQRIRYTYDSHGRMLYKTCESVDDPDRHKRTALHLQYNANNEVVKSLSREYQGNKVKQTITNYQYDAFSRRIAKHSETRQLQIEQNSFKQQSKTQRKHTHMLWDGDKLIQEYSDNHVFTTVYDQASFAPVARLVWLREETINKQVSEQDKDWLTKFNDKERETRVNLREIPSFYDDYVKKDKLEAILGIKVYYYHNDQLGTPNELTNEKGEVIWLADLAAWGNISKEKYQSQAIGDFEISAEDLQPIRFQGQSFDSETGLHYNRFRYYDPDMGMFISRDPIGLKGGENLFKYVPNPTKYMDPLGLVKCYYNSDGKLVCGGSNNPGTAPELNGCVTADCAAGIGTKIKDGDGPFGPVCGAEGSKAATWIPDGIYKSACEEHDKCYATCGKTKFECDKDFAYNGAVYQSALLMTVFYTQSSKAYESAQKKSGCKNQCTQ